MHHFRVDEVTYPIVCHVREVARRRVDPQLGLFKEGGHTHETRESRTAVCQRPSAQSLVDFQEP